MNTPSDVIEGQILALDALQELAKKHQAVWLTISDCGCITVELFADGVKICEEDKSLPVVVAAVLERVKSG